jgi:hypothetical protein
MSGCRVALVSLVLGVSACGGKVLFDPDASSGGGAGTGGQGEGASSSEVGVATVGVAQSSASTGDNCFALGEELDRATNEAIACDPTIDLLQCSGAELLTDRCGCKGVVANETRPEAVQAARAAYDAWVAGGCGPFECGGACQQPAGGICDPGSSTCQPAKGL